MKIKELAIRMGMGAAVVCGALLASVLMVACFKAIGGEFGDTMAWVARISAFLGLSFYFGCAARELTK